MSKMQLFKLILPLIILEFILKGISLYSIVKGKPKHLPKWVWAIIVISVSTIGPIGYLIFGRGEVSYDD